MEGGKATARPSATRRLGAVWKKKLKGAGGGLGGLAVMALVGLVAFVCGVAVLTLAAFSLTDLRHTHLSFVSTDCTIIDHIATTRTRCSHGCTLRTPYFVPLKSQRVACAVSCRAGRTLVRPQLVVAFKPRPEHAGDGIMMEQVHTTARWRAGHQWQEEGTARGFFRRNPVNATRECFYDPRNLASVVMEKEFVSVLSFWAWLGGSLLVSLLCILVAAYLFYLVILWAPLGKFGFGGPTADDRVRPPPGGAINAASHDYGTFVGGPAGDYTEIGDGSDSDEDVEIELQPRRKQAERLKARALS